MRAVVVVAILVAGVAITPIAGITAAQSSEENVTNGNETTEEEEDQILKPLGNPDNPGAVITNIEVEGSTFYVTIEAHEYTQVSINDAGKRDEVGEGETVEIPYETFTIPSGETRTLEFSVDPTTDTRAITITGHGTMFVHVHEKSLFGGKASWTEVQAGVAAGLLVMGAVVLGFGVLAYRAMRRDYRRVI